MALSGAPDPNQSNCGKENYVENVKSFPSYTEGGADLRCRSPQPDTSLHCETMDTGLMHRVVCLFTPRLMAVPKYQLVIGAHGCEQLAQSRHAAAPWPGIKLVNS